MAPHEFMVGAIRCIVVPDGEVMHKGKRQDKVGGTAFD